MNDPWNVKSVRQGDQYVSCMRINGVPLLPPVLSKDCRKEMLYYKLLAKEVEKRISLLQPHISESNSESEDKTDAPDLPESEQIFELPHEELQAGFNVNIDKIPAINATKNKEKSMTMSPRHTPVTDICNNITSNVVVESIGSRSNSNSPTFVIDLSLRINETSNNLDGVIKNAPHSPHSIDVPERDYNCMRRVTQKVITEKEIITKLETQRNKTQKDTEEVSSFSFNLNKSKSISDPIAEMALPQNGPSSLSSKSFTGSLNDLHSESTRDMHGQKLIRQASYTLLTPSPQLLAHLEVQAMNTGIEMTSISMSESLSNINSPTKKRRSWDLESAKVKWSSMAMELKQTSVVQNLNRNASSKNMSKPLLKNSSPTSQIKAKSVPVEKPRRTIVTPKPMIKSDLIRPVSSPSSEPHPKIKKANSPVRNTINRTSARDPTSPKVIKKPEALMTKHPPSESDDPATRIRELYEKIQNQQLIQMASLVEKQKREQMLLQQVFEEQNNLLFKQLKTICPKSPIEVKEAWGDKHPDGDRGPVSLSQLINYKSPAQSSLESPVLSILTDTNKDISRCDNVLKRSRDITGSIKKQPVKSHNQNGIKITSPRTQLEGSRTRTHSPVSKNSSASRKLEYDTSVSSDRDYEPILTDRTNDTLADLNVTFPSDNSEDGSAITRHNNSVVTLMSKGIMKSIHGNTHTSSAIHSRTADDAIKKIENTIHNSVNNTNARISKANINNQPTPKERAAATKIVALAKGYLVRRLMRTERVQTTVQTIKDALLCALQLHQDREGIRGADVDLHRRLIQQITAACYSLHDTFVASTAAERCAMIAADRGRRRSLAARQANSFKQTDLMSQSHSGAFPARTKRQPAATLMTQSNYETFSGDKRSSVSVSRYMASPHRRPWR